MNIQIVPAYLEVDGEKVQVGTARVDVTTGNVEVSVSDLMPVEVLDQIVGGLSVSGVLIEELPAP